VLFSDESHSVSNENNDNRDDILANSTKTASKNASKTKERVRSCFTGVSRGLLYLSSGMMIFDKYCILTY